MTETKKITNSSWKIDDRVESGEIAEDYDTGRVVEINGSDITVAWDGSLEKTTQDGSLLRPEVSR